jgi:hypothetical protein
MEKLINLFKENKKIAIFVGFVVLAVLVNFFGFN